MSAVSNKSDQVSVVNACFTCGKTNDPKAEKKILKECGKCNFHTYCSSDCQKAFWSIHKVVCKDTGGGELRKQYRKKIEVMVNGVCKHDQKEHYIVLFIDSNFEPLKSQPVQYTFRKDLKANLNKGPEQFLNHKKELIALIEKHPDNAIIEVLQEANNALAPVGNFVFAVQKKI